MKDRNYIDVLYSHEYIDYKDALRYMHFRISDIILGKSRECIWFLEHKNVYTIGSGDVDELKKSNIEVLRVDRGGKLTYHGPGQRVIYLMLNLRKLSTSPDIRNFIRMINNWFSNSLNIYDLEVLEDFSKIGIWVRNKNTRKKIASIGLKIKKWVSYHGIALNINTDMSYFDSIYPCGMDAKYMTSLSKEKGKKFSVSEMDNVLLDEFLKIFNYDAKIHEFDIKKWSKNH